MAGSFFLFATFRPRMALPRVAGAGLLGVALGPALVPALGSGLRAVVKSGLGLLPGATADAGASSGHALRHRTALSCPTTTTAPGPLSGHTLGRGRCAELDQRAPLQLWPTAHSIDRRDTN